jgi:hypothetical protein
VIPLHPKRHRVMPRNWSAEPERRVVRNLQYRTKYGQGIPAPTSPMIRNLRQQEEFRRVPA